LFLKLRKHQLIFYFELKRDLLNAFLKNQLCGKSKD